jgi:hypothetical protein
VVESPEYLERQSRLVHRLYRRNRVFGNWTAVLICVVGIGLSIASVFDWALSLGWDLGVQGFWAGLGAVAFAGFFWLFFRTILSILRGVGRRLYGPDPDEIPD